MNQKSKAFDPETGMFWMHQLVLLSVALFFRYATCMQYESKVS